MLTSRTVLREKRSTRYPAGTPAIAMPSVNTVASSPPACRLIPYSWRIVGRSGAKIWRSAALIMKDTARTRNPTATTSAGTLGSARCALPPAAPTSAGTGLIGTASTGTTSMGTATMGIVYLSVGTVYVSVDTAGTVRARVGVGSDIIRLLLKKAVFGLRQVPEEREPARRPGRSMNPDVSSLGGGPPHAFRPVHKPHADDQQE